jgi:LemA protein
MTAWQMVLIGVLVAAILWVVWTFNRLVALRARAKGSWADIDVQLKKRWDLVPRLVETVRGYTAHERSTLEDVVRARQGAEASEGEGARARGVREAELGRGVDRLVALVEAYPDLKADRMFASLHRELVAVEDALQSARRYYNAVVRDLNTKIAQFPSNLVATLAGVRRMEYFEIEEGAEREAVRVEMGER